MDSDLTEIPSSINLMDFSFKLINFSTDSIGESNDDNKDSEKNPLVGELMDNLIGHVESEQQHDESINPDEECNDKENEQPSKSESLNSSFRKNLSFEMFEARVEQKRLSLQSNAENQREILKEIKADDENLGEKKDDQNEETKNIDNSSDSTDMTLMLKSFNPNSSSQTEIDTQCIIEMSERLNDNPPETKEQFSHEHLFEEFSINEDTSDDLSLFRGELDGKIF
ncbi:hypothetical protein BLA29_006762, partial [Euroglyphus maynei]